MHDVGLPHDTEASPAPEATTVARAKCTGVDPLVVVDDDEPVVDVGWSEEEVVGVDEPVPHPARARVRAEQSSSGSQNAGRTSDHLAVLRGELSRST